MKLPPALVIATSLVVLSLLPMARATEPNCQLVSTDGGNIESETFSLKTSNGAGAGYLKLSVDQSSGQLRFDSYTYKDVGYKMYEQHIWFGSVENEQELPNDPSDFFMKAKNPLGTIKWIGMWVVNPFYCGPQTMVLSAHYSLKGLPTNGLTVDSYAYKPGSSHADTPGAIHAEQFHLQCTPCDQWQEPEPWTPDDLKPDALQEFENKGQEPEPSATTTTTENEETPGSSNGGSNESTGTNDSNATVTLSNQICIEGDQEESCQDLVAQDEEGGGQVKVGDLCVLVNPMTNLLEITATALQSYTFLRTQLWTSTDGIGNMPVNKDGAPDTGHFPKYQCSFTGLPKITWELPLAEQCNSSSSSTLLELTVVAHALVTSSDLDGDKMDAFAAQTIGESPVFYGYMTVPVSCDCPHGDQPGRKKAMLRHRQI